MEKRNQLLTREQLQNLESRNDASQGGVKFDALLQDPSLMPLEQVANMMGNALRGGAAAAYDTEAQAYFTALEAAGATITPTIKAEYNLLVTTLKSLNNSGTGASEWAQIYELGLLIHTPTGSTAPIRIKAKHLPAKSALLTLTNIAAADYTLAGGLKGDAGIDRSFATDMTPNDLNSADLHVMVGYNLLAEETLNAAKLYGVPTGEFQCSWATSNLRLNTYANDSQAGQIISALEGNAGINIYNGEAANIWREYHAGLVVASTATTRNAFNSTEAISFLWLGSGNSHFSGYHWGYSMGRKFDPNNMLAIDAAFRRMFTALGRDWGNVFFEGDATVLGTGATNGAYTSRTMKVAGGRLGQFNSGTTGHTLATINSNKATEYPTRITAADIYFLHAGYHDLNAGTTGIAMFDYVDLILTYVQQTLGVFNMVVATLPGSADYNAAEEAERIVYNDLIRINQATYGYAIADFANDPDIGTSNVTYFTGNQNFNDAGALIAAGIAGEAVLSVSRYTNVVPGASGNRIATEADRVLYGSFITVGDLIIDTRTNADGDATYYFMGTQWPTLTGSPTIWFDGDMLCPGGSILNEIKFQNGSNNNTAWTVNSATFKNIPGTKVITKDIVCNGLLNWTLQGEGTIQGMYDEFEAGTRFFSTGYFGFHVINSLFNGHGVAGTVRNGGSINLSGIEIQHGFSGVRLMATAGVEITVANLTIHDLYIHDTLSEAFYLGSTKGGSQAIPLFASGSIYQCVICRSGGESLQLQNFAGIDTHDITIINADMDWLAAFQPFQDSAIQIVFNGGINKLRNIMMHGYGSTAILPFGVPVISYVPQGVNTALFENCLFSAGRSIGIYFNNACSNGTAWTLNDLKFIDFNDTYYPQTGVTPLTHYINSGGSRADVVNINNLNHDGSKAVVTAVGSYNVSGTVLNGAMAAPLFDNYGFPDVKNVMRWSPIIGYYFPVADNTPVHYLAGQYVQYIDEDADTLRYFLILHDHDATATPPPGDATNYQLITWDEAGVRSDAVGWASGDDQSFYPPDRVTLQAGSPYSTMGFQLV